MKPTLCLDFDGVLHSYSSGWKGADVIPDPPVPGAMQFLLDASSVFTIAIFSSRSHQPGGLQAMQVWLALWLREWASERPSRWPSDGWRADLLASIQWPTEKPAAFVSIDDRAIQFNGTWPAIEELRAFKPWNKR